jgi:hypothetical protein
MTKTLSACLTALVALLVPVAGAQAAPTKSKLRFSSASYVVAENGGSATITVTRTPRNPKARSATNSIVSVAYATSDDTAVAGSDYTASSGRLTFPACGPSPAATDPCLVQQFTVPITDDDVADGNETVKLALTSPSRTTVVVNPQKATLTIADNEGPTQVTFDAAGYRAWELGPSAEIHVIRSGAGISGSSSVDFATADGDATAGSDYTGQSSTLSFTPGQVDKAIFVPIKDDAVSEPTESFSVGLSNPSGGTTIATASAPVTILDDDTVVNAHLGFEVSSSSVDEGADVTITVNRDNSVDTSVSVDYATIAQTATADVDFTALADTLDFDPGDMSLSFTVPTISDNGHEGDETFAVRLNNQVPSATVLDTDTTTVTIADDDAAPTISAGPGTAGDGSVSFEIVISNPSDTDVTVDYVIRDADGNEVATGTATIPAGSTSTTVTEPVTGDGPWSIELSNAGGGSIDAAHSSSTTQDPAADTGTGGSTDTSGSATGESTGTSGTGSSSGSADPVVTVTPGTDGTVAIEEPTDDPGTSASPPLAKLPAKLLSACRLTVRAGNRVGRRGLLLRMRAGHTCTVTLGASVRGTGGKRSKSTSVRALKTKRHAVKLRRGKTRTVRLRFSKRALGFIKRALKARRPMTLTVVVIEKDSRKRVTKRTTRTRLRR